jgi:hypothetical protein
VTEASYPKLDEAWRPVVEWASVAPEIAGITYGPNYLQLHYQLGAARSSLMIASEQIRQAAKPSVWQERISLALMQLRLARAGFVVQPRSAEEWDDIGRRRVAEGLVE